MKTLIKSSKSKLKKKLSGTKNSNILVHSITIFLNDTDLLIKKRLSSGEVNFDCKKGCSFCCTLRVEVLPPEAFRIASFIMSMPENKRNTFIEKLREHVNYASGKVFVEYNKPCPFLNLRGECEIYEVRPHKCRAQLSKNRTACETGRDADKDQLLREATNQLAYSCVDIYKSKNCTMNPAELGQSVLAAIENDQLREKWAHGEQVFPLLPEGFIL